MANYVLVHGAWGGGQSYTKTAADLKAAGHNVLVSTQTGIGVRQPELHGGITLTDHVNDVEQQIEEAGMERFIVRRGRHPELSAGNGDCPDRIKESGLCHLPGHVSADDVCIRFYFYWLVPTASAIVRR